MTDVTSPLTYPLPATADVDSDGPTCATTAPATPTNAVGPFATAANDVAAADIDHRRVTRLAMYPREQLFLVYLDDGVTRSTDRAVYYALLRALERDPARRLTQVTAGIYDHILRVEMREPETEEASRGH
jgi:hypothetical protein